MSISVMVAAPFALFTRPELKVERYSYSVMTPSAARGILEAIYWHPGIRWEIESIRVCNPIRFISVKRNEVSAKASSDLALGEMKLGAGHFTLDPDNCRQPRHSLILRDVRYIICAHFVFTKKARKGHTAEKTYAIVSRRLTRGQCFKQPYLGCREFTCSFRPINPIEAKAFPCPKELEGETELGLMLYDLDFSASGDVNPMLFKAKLVNGILTVPSLNSSEVIKC